MPVYNSGEYLKIAVESILSQSLKEFELILVDDGSTDGSSEQCDEYACKDERVVVIHQQNRGICNARNAALKVAKGEYIAFSDHDDEYLPGLLEKIYARAIYDGADVVKFCKREQVVFNHVVIRDKTTRLNDAVYKEKEIKNSFFKLLNDRIFECVWDGIFRKALLTDNCIEFDTTYKMGGEDIDFLMKVLAKTKILSTVSTIYYRHYIRIGFSTSSKFNMLKIENTKNLARRITEKCKVMGIDISRYRKEYVYQIMFLYINGIANILADPQCTIKERDKLQIIRKLTEEDFLPSWFLKVSSLSVLKLDKKCGLAYFLYKYKFYSLFFLLFKVRRKQLKAKA